MRHTTAAQYITPLNDSSGMTFETIGKVAISNTQWNILQKINLKPLLLEDQEAYKTWKILNDSCGNIAGMCDLSQEILEQLHENSIATRELISLIQGHNLAFMERDKRSVLPFVGRISRILFGTLDEDSLQEIEGLVESSANESRKLASLLASQTEIVESQLNLTNSKIEELHENLMKINFIEGEIQQIHSVELLQNILFTLSEHVSQHARNIQMITNAILFATRGVIHPHLLSPEIIRNSAAAVQNTLNGVSLPLSDSEPFTKLFDVADVQVIFTKFHLIYRISIPLIDTQRFTLIKITPLPIKQSIGNLTNTFAYIRPEHSYLAISNHSRLYFPIDVHTLNDCKVVRKLRICKNTEPVREINENASCELNAIIAHSSIDSASCNIKIIQLRQTYWVRLHAANSWAFSTLSPEHIFIQCRRGDHFSSHLSGTGILKLDPECAAHTADALLTPTRMVDSYNPTLTPLNGPFNVSLIIKETLENTEFSQVVPQVIDEASANSTNTKSNLFSDASADAGTTLRDIIEKARALSRYQTLQGKLGIYQTSSIVVIGVGIAIAAVLALAIIRCSLTGYWRREGRNGERQIQLGNLEQALRELRNQNAVAQTTS